MAAGPRLVDGAPADYAAAMIRAPISLALTLALLPEAALAQAAPKPGATKTFGDWAVGCDNGLRCTMLSLTPEDAERGETSLRVMRDAGPAGGWRVTVQPDDERPRGLAIDGRRVGGAQLDYRDSAAAAIVAALVNGRAMQVLTPAGKTQSAISLKGASAALRYIDAQQGRVGTRGAAVAKGTAPDTRVPVPPPLPVIVARAPDGVAARPTAAQIRQMQKIGQCDATDFGGDATPVPHAVGNGTTLIFVPCSSGAYNLSVAVFTLKGGRIAPARADVPTGFGEGGAPSAPASLVNADVTKGVITSYAKGRGVGDCGTSQSFVWDGTRLRLSEMAVMDECRGNTDLITTWRATVRWR